MELACINKHINFEHLPVRKSTKNIIPTIVFGKYIYIFFFFGGGDYRHVLSKIFANFALQIILTERN